MTLFLLTAGLILTAVWTVACQRRQEQLDRLAYQRDCDRRRRAERDRLCAAWAPQHELN